MHSPYKRMNPYYMNRLGQVIKIEGDTTTKYGFKAQLGGNLFIMAVTAWAMYCGKKIASLDNTTPSEAAKMYNKGWEAGRKMEESVKPSSSPLGSFWSDTYQGYIDPGSPNHRAGYDKGFKDGKYLEQTFWEDDHRKDKSTTNQGVQS